MLHNCSKICTRTPEVAIPNNKSEAMLIMEYLKDLTLVLLVAGRPPNPTANLQQLCFSPYLSHLRSFNRPNPTANLQRLCLSPSLSHPRSIHWPNPTAIYWRSISGGGGHVPLKPFLSSNYDNHGSPLHLSAQQKSSKQSKNKPLLGKTHIETNRKLTALHNWQ
jgi:hypothetical protein